MPGKDVTAGQKIFADNCASATASRHRATARSGAPGWPSQVHLYGDDRATVVAQITNPRMGVMPPGTRGSIPPRSRLALYVHSLGGGE